MTPSLEKKLSWCTRCPSDILANYDSLGAQARAYSTWNILYLKCIDLNMVDSNSVHICWYKRLKRNRMKEIQNGKRKEDMMTEI